MILKNKRIRLKGNALRELYDYVYERDGGRCIVCDRPIAYGEIPHHIDFGIDKEDTKFNLCLLCLAYQDACHAKAHGPGQKEIARRCREYIDRME